MPRSKAKAKPEHFIAHSLGIGLCGECEGVHIELYGADKKLGATAVIPLDEVPDFVSQVEKVSYRLAERLGR